jgi:hypothetical protein
MPMTLSVYIKVLSKGFGFELFFTPRFIQPYTEGYEEFKADVVIPARLWL